MRPIAPRLGFVLLALATIASGACGDACPPDPSTEDAGEPLGTGIPVFDAGPATPPVVQDAGPGVVVDAGVIDSGINTGPVFVESVTPSTGVLTGGYRVRVAGFGFTPPLADGTPTTVIKLGDSECVDQVFISVNLITCRVTAAAAAGPVDVSAANEDGAGLLPGGFTYFSPVEIATIDPASGTTEGGTAVTITGISFSPAMVVLVGGRPAVNLAVAADGLSATFTTPPGTPGRTDVEAIDAFGRSVIPLGFTYANPLSVGGVEPATVATGATPQVEVHGAGFDAATTVTIGGAPAAVINFVDEARVVVRAPGGLAAGFHDVVVTGAGGSATLAGAFYVLPAVTGTPTVSAVVPSSGDALGGDLVLVVGEGLTSTTAVSFGGVAATELAVLDDRRAQVRTPAGVAGPVDVVATTGGGDLTLVAGFTYADRPATTAVAPASGPATGGTPVTINGRGFVDGAVVTFGGQPATDVVVVDPATITATTPAGTSGRVDVVVATPSGARAVLADAFTYEAPLSILGVRPSRGGIAGGTFVTITGSGFARGPGVVVLFGDFPADPADTVVVSDTTVTTRTPIVPGPGILDVSVVGVDGDDVDTEVDVVTASRAYTYFNPTMLVGGTRGGPIEGAVYVTALDAIAAMPIPDLPVFIGTDGTSQYVTKTDLRGQATLSGPDLFGPQTVSITGDGFEYATVVDVNAQEITLYLFPLRGGPPAPPQPGPEPPPPGTVMGRVTGFAKELFDPAAIDTSGCDPAGGAPTGTCEIALAVVETTARDEFSSAPHPGFKNIVFEEGGSYIIGDDPATPAPDGQVRVGRLAVVAIAGIFDLFTGDFRPRQMGVLREVYPDYGLVLEDQDVELTISLDEEVEFSMPDAPLNAVPDPLFGAPTVTRVVPFVRMGGEGAFFPRTLGIEGVRNHDIDAMADLPGEMMTFIAGAYTTDGQGLVTNLGTASLEQGSNIATGVGTDWNAVDFQGNPVVEGAILVVECDDGTKFASTVILSMGADEVALDERARCDADDAVYHIGNPTFPSSQVVQDGVGDLRGGVTIQPMLGLPEAQSPLPNGVLENRTLRWKAAPGQQPTIHQMYLYEALEFKVLWSFYVDGLRTKVPVPIIPSSVNALDIEVPPSDLVPGGYVWDHTAIYTPGLDFNNWSYLEIGSRGRRSWTENAHLFIYGGM